MDGARRIAMVETKTVGTTTTPLPSTVTRYQLDNHLQSASLELDETANVISYEEYYPYGDTSYRSARRGVEVSEKRYRYTGKEKDEETGLYYHGARYYAAWLGRWTAADPAGMVDGACLYAYVRNHPTGLVDPDGRAGVSQQNPQDATFVAPLSTEEMAYKQLPAYNAGVEAPEKFGKPYRLKSEAENARIYWSPIVLAGIAIKVSPRVVPLWNLYLQGGTATSVDLNKADPTFRNEFQNDNAILDAQSRIQNDVMAFFDQNQDLLPSNETKTYDLKDIIPSTMLDFGDYRSPQRLNFMGIGTIPGNLVGDFGPPGDQSSHRFGKTPSTQDDSRFVDGTVKITPSKDGELFSMEFDVNFKITDTIDLLPGNWGNKRNPGLKSAIKETFKSFGPAETDATVPMSRLEASGVAGDVPVHIEFDTKFKSSYRTKGLQ